MLLKVEWYKQMLIVWFGFCVCVLVAFLGQGGECSGFCLLYLLFGWVGGFCLVLF